MSKNCDDTYTPILDNKCAVCKICCHGDVPEGISGYNNMLEIQSGKVPANLIKKMVVYRIPEAKMDAAADHNWHFPFDKNILRNLTKPKDGVYEFLAIPYAKDDCIFLGPNGCVYEGMKAFDCCMFPFYYRHGEFYKEDWCELTKGCNDDERKAQLKKCYEDYDAFNLKHQNDYFETLPKLKKKYKFKIIDF